MAIKVFVGDLVVDAGVAPIRWLIKRTACAPLCLRVEIEFGEGRVATYYERLMRGDLVVGEQRLLEKVVAAEVAPMAMV